MYLEIGVFALDAEEFLFFVSSESILHNHLSCVITKANDP